MAARTLTARTETDTTVVERIAFKPGEVRDALRAEAKKLGYFRDDDIPDGASVQWEWSLQGGVLVLERKAHVSNVSYDGN